MEQPPDRGPNQGEFGSADSPRRDDLDLHIMIPQQQQQQQMARWKQSHAIGAPVGASAKRGTADTEAAAAKRAKLLQHIGRHGARSLTLALESTLPAGVTWALTSALHASCGAEGNSTSEKLEALVNLTKNPPLLGALLPLALPEAADEAQDALRPCPPNEAQLRALKKLHRRQAWLVLRNMSLIADNEGPMLQSAPLRALLIHTLQRGFHEAEPLPPLTRAVVELAEPDDSAAAESSAPVRESYGGRGRARARSAYGVRGRYPKAAGIASSSAASTLVVNVEAGTGPGREVPLLSEEFEPRLHGLAAEVLSNICRQARLDDLLVRLPADAALSSSMPENVPELCGLLTQLLRSGEVALAMPAVEAAARLCAVDHNESHLHAMFAAEPSLASVFIASLEPEDANGGALPPDDRARLQEAALDVLCVFSAAALPLRLHLARERSLLPRLLALVGGTNPQGASRRAAAVLNNLASAPGNHNAFRPYEGALAGFAMHPPGEFGANVGTVIAEVALELNPTPAW